MKSHETCSTDEALYEHFLELGSQVLMEELAQRWEQRAFQIARCICGNEALAEEAVQDAFLILLARKAVFRNRGAGTFRAWFLSLVTNCARTARRTERRAEAKKHVNPFSFAHCKFRSRASAPAAEPSETPEVLENILAGFEEHVRTPVVLHFREGLRQKEVAQRLGISQQLVSRRIEHGLSLLRLQLA